MCYHDQYQFACGDFKFGHFRRRCNRVSPPGKSCTSKTAHEVFQLQRKCSLCEKIATNRRGQRQEWDRIEGLESKELVDDKAVQYSIGIINQLQREILTLESERRGWRFPASDEDLKGNGSATLGPVVETADLVAESATTIVTKSSPSLPLEKLEEWSEGHSSLPSVPPSVTRESDALQPAEREAHRLGLSHEKRSKDIEVLTANTFRENLAKNVTDVLDKWFKEHLAYPYPSETEKKQLCSSTGLSMRQLGYWLVISRRRLNLAKTQKAFAVDRQGSTGHLAARIAKACTILPLHVFGNLSTISLCHLYRTLQWVLCQSQWQSISATYPSSRAFKDSRRPSAIDGWISKPFPGFWTCTRGFILWRSPFHGATAQTNPRAFCLSSIDNVVLGNLTRVYWHALCRPSRVPRQCHASSLPKAHPRRTECRNCLSATLSLSNLKRTHEDLLRLLIDRQKVTENSNENQVLRKIETLKSTRVLCWNSKTKNFAVRGGSYVSKSIEHQRSSDVVGDSLDELSRGSGRPLNSANQIQPRISSGVASDAPKLCFPWMMVNSTMKALVLKGLRVVGLCEPLLEEGKSRVRWKCRCGRSMFDDFIERRPGAARDLEQSLNQSTVAGSGPPQGQRSATTSPSNNLPTTIRVEGQNSWNVDSSLETPPRSYEPCPRRRVKDSVSINCDPERHWLLVCARSKERPTSLTQLDLCSTTSDKELFQELRLTYMSLKGKWARIFSFRKVQSIRFVQFELHIKDLVDIRKVPDMPSETKKHEYLYQPCDLVPPVGENLMAHLFHHPEDANERSITCLRAPKKRKAKLSICPQQGTSVGWGIHLVEGWVVARVWLLVLLLFFGGSVAFGVCWAVLQRDVQTAFGVSAYIVALGGLLAGTVQAFLA